MNFIIRLEVYPFDVMFSFAQSDAEVKQALQEHFPQYASTKNWKLSEGGDARYVVFPGGASIVRMKERPITPFLKGVLAHEIFHLVTVLMNKIGVKLVVSVSDEPYAYLTGFITEKVYEKFDL